MEYIDLLGIVHVLVVSCTHRQAVDDVDIYIHWMDVNERFSSVRTSCQAGATEKSIHSLGGFE